MRWTLRQLAIGLAFGGPLAAAIGCSGDAVTAPSTGGVEITTATSGPTPDVDGYTLSIDGATEVAIAVNDTHRQESLEPGSHSIRLAGMAANCTVAGDNPRTVSVQPGSNATVGFTITCGATTGSLGLTVTTGGSSPDADGYTVTVDGAERGTIAASGGITLEGLAQGDHLVGLNGLAGNCQVQGENPRTATVTAAASASVAFAISCSAAPANAGSIRVTTTTTGSDPDPDGYAFALDGGSSQPIGINATTISTNVASGPHSVRLSKLANNCSVSGDNPRSAAVTTGATAEVSFAVVCTAASGTIQVTTTTTGSLPDPNGYTVAVDNAAPQAIGVSATLTVPAVSVGPHQVTLAGLAANCHVGGDNPRVSTVSAGGTAILGFDISCTAPQTFRISWAKGRLGATENATYDIYAMNAEGSAQTRVTSSPATQVQHQWSPDGHRMLFVRGNDLYAINSDGSGEARLNTPGGGTNPQWSPDGTRIAYEGALSIHVVNSDGSGDAKLTEGGSYGPRWSPDGGRIVFTRIVDDGAQLNEDIYTVNSDGGGEIQLSQNPVDGHRDLDRDPVWSPTGNKILFWRERDDVADIYVMDPDGSNQTRLTNTPQQSEITPAWSPDGKRIAFAFGDNGSFDLKVMNADGSGQTNLTNTPSADETWFSWSPDGARIAFARESPPAGSGEIWVMDANGANMAQLTRTPDSEDDLNPIWQP